MTRRVIPRQLRVLSDSTFSVTWRNFSIRHDHLAIGRGGEGRLRGIGEFQPCFVEFFQNAEADLVTGQINLLEVRIEDIEFQFEIKRTRTETDKAAADERAAIGFDNFPTHSWNTCGTVRIRLISEANPDRKSMQ